MYFTRQSLILSFENPLFVVFQSHMNNLKLHVFINRAEKDHSKIHQLRDAYGDQIVVHVSLTESKEGPWTVRPTSLFELLQNCFRTKLNCGPLQFWPLLFWDPLILVHHSKKCFCVLRGVIKKIAPFDFGPRPNHLRE